MGVTRQTKMCIRCRTVRPVSDFPKHAGWSEQKFCDVYCTECARELVFDKESTRKYFWENNRLWDERIWEGAKVIAQRRLAADDKYIAKKMTREDRQKMEDDAIAKSCLSVMNRNGLFHHADNVNEDDPDIVFDPESKKGQLLFDGGVEDLDEAKQYDAVWNGYYTNTELQYLNTFYTNLEKEFQFEDVALIDAARKCAKSSLMYDNVFNRYREGKADLDEVKAAHKIYDDSMKSANFSACKRKDNSNSNVSMGEIIAMLESEGALMINPPKWKKDSVDLILDDFYHTRDAVGEDV